MKYIVKIGLAIVALVILASSLWVNFATNKANKLIDQANAAVEAGNQIAEQAGAKYGELFTESNLASFPDNREQLAPTAQNLAELLGNAAEQYESAATKFEEASHEGVKQAVAEYWSLKAQQFRKFAESKRAFRTVALLIPDEAVASLDAFNEQVDPLIDQALKLDAESKEFATQADKLESENKDSFAN
jgi:hypothetical protein